MQGRARVPILREGIAIEFLVWQTCVTNKEIVGGDRGRGAEAVHSEVGHDIVLIDAVTADSEAAVAACRSLVPVALRSGVDQARRARWRE